MAERPLAPLYTPLGLHIASQILDGTLKAARDADLLPLTVAVLDLGGNLVALKREDGCGILRADIAIAKAHGALGMGMSSRTIRDRLSERVGFQAALAAASGGEFIPVPGGVLILNANNEAIGAVGVSGDASDKDEYAAILGVQTANLMCDPSTPNPNWAQASL